MPDFDRAVVEEIKTLDVSRCEAALRQGDLVQRLIPLGSDHTNNGAWEALEALAEETGVSAKTLEMRRLVAVRVPETLRRGSATYTAYAEAAMVADPAERTALLERMRTPHLGTRSGRWTVDAVRAHLGHAERRHDALERALRDADAERLAQAAATLMSSPAVVAAAAADPESPVAQAMEDMADAVMRRRLEEASGEPTERVSVYVERVHDAKASSPSYQYLRVRAILSAFMARFPIDAVAGDLVGQGSTDRPDIYVQGAEESSAWFARLAQALRAEARPRVVVRSVESAS